MMNQNQNMDENCAEHWLRQQGFQDIARPCSDPPDFVVNGECAVEVTRLNQRIVVPDQKESVAEEEVSIRLTHCIENVIDRLGPPGIKGRSWIVDVEYDLSNPGWLISGSSKVKISSKVVAKQISEALTQLTRPYDSNVISGLHAKYLDHDRHAGEISHLGFPHLCLECGLCLELAEFSHASEKFILQNVSDGEGSHLAEELSKSVHQRIRDKSGKLQRNNKVKEEYESWWLILVDHVSHVPMQVLSSRELYYIRNQEFDFWSRVVIVSSRSPYWHCQLHPIQTET